jgi:hypothetical protein
MCDTGVPFSGSQAIRISSHAGNEEAAPDGVELLKKVHIASWKEFADTPHPEDHEPLGLQYSFNFDAGVLRVRYPKQGLDLPGLDVNMDVAEVISNARKGDKLGGWPYWIQGAEYPNCPKCGSQMHLLMQLDPGDNLPYRFGDAGCGHLTQCKNHPETFAFGWACD